MSSRVASGSNLRRVDHRAAHRRGEDQLREAPGVKHRRHHHRRFLGVPRHAIQHRFEFGCSATGVLGALGITGGARGQQDQPALAAGVGGSLAEVGGDQLLDGDVVLFRVVGPPDDAGGVGLVCQCAVNRVGELFVVDHRVGALAVDYVGQSRAGERRVEQQHVGADPVGRDQRLDETAMVAAHDGQHFRCSAG